jgi:hypothetical protein
MLGDLPILECARCDGVWVGAADFDRICANREAQAAVLERRRSAQAPASRPAPVHYRASFTPSRRSSWMAVSIWPGNAKRENWRLSVIVLRF